MKLRNKINSIDKNNKTFLGLWFAFIVGIGVINQTYLLTILYIGVFFILAYIVKPESIYDTVFELMMVSMIFDYTVHFPGISKLYVFHIILFIFSLLSLVNIIKEKGILNNLDKKIIIILCVLFSFIVISFIWAMNKSFAIQFILIYVMMMVFIADMLIYNINKGRLEKTIKVVVSLFLFIVLVGLFETITGNQLPVLHNFTTAAYTPLQMAICNSKPIAFSYNVNNYACMLALMLPFALFSIYKTNNKIVKLILAFCSTFCFGLIMITTSRTGYVAALVSISGFILISLIEIKKIRKIDIIILIVISIGLVSLYKYSYLVPNVKTVVDESGNKVDYEGDNRLISKMQELEGSGVEYGGEGSVNVRWTIAQDIFTGVIKERNLVGFGAGNAQEYIRLKGNTGGTYSTHSLLIELLGDFGIVGVGIYGVMYFYLLIRNTIFAIKKKDRTSIAVTIGLIALAPASFGPSTITYIFLYWTLLAIAASNIQVKLIK